jgi:YgiT-type zinc finger domain-containing protein
MNCTLCKAELIKDNVNHIIDLGEGIIIIKNVPANVCTQCGEYYVDTQVALKLENIVDEAKKNKAEILILNYNEMVA